MSSSIPLTVISSFFNETRREEALRQVLQFDNLPTLLQYKKAYGAALRYLSPEKHVLDWGCGNGHFSYFLVRRNVSTTGYSFDSIPPFLKNNPAFRFVSGNVSEPARLPFAESTFDIVFSIGVLEHVHETGGSDEQSLREIHRILKPGGLFICAHLPNKYQWIEPVGKILGVNEHFHNVKYTRSLVRDLTRRTGFQIDEIGRYNFLPRNQLRFLPGWIKNSFFFVRTYEACDAALAMLLPRFCTNYYFVAHAEK